MNARQRADLFNEWGPFDRSSRGRDHEEMMADSTERLMNSKRILLETIQASSDTLGSLGKPIFKNKSKNTFNGNVIIYV